MSKKPTKVAGQGGRNSGKMGSLTRKVEIMYTTLINNEARQQPTNGKKERDTKGNMWHYIVVSVNY